MREKLKYACMQSCDVVDGTRDHTLAGLCFDIGMDCYPAPVGIDFGLGAISGKQARRIEEKNLRREVKQRAMAKVSANPEKYGFGGVLGMIWLTIEIASIVAKVVRFLMDVRYGLVKDFDDDAVQGVR